MATAPSRARNLRSQRVRGGVLVGFLLSLAAPTVAQVAHAVQMAAAPWLDICSTAADHAGPAVATGLLRSTVPAGQRRRGGSAPPRGVAR